MGGRDQGGLSKGVLVSQIGEKRDFYIITPPHGGRGISPLVNLSECFSQFPPNAWNSAIIWAEILLLRVSPSRQAYP
jgi:hypothetical protein